MTAETHGAVLTYDDLKQMPDDRNRYEIIEGVLHVTPAPNAGHQRAVLRLARPLDEHVTVNGLGEVFIAPFDVKLDEKSVVQPDVLFVARNGRAVNLGSHIVGPPDLVIEVLSPSTTGRDMRTKWQLYAAHGVPHYWYVDTDARQITALALRDGEYR